MTQTASAFYSKGVSADKTALNNNIRNMRGTHFSVGKQLAIRLKSTMCVPFL